VAAPEDRRGFHQRKIKIQIEMKKLKSFFQSLNRRFILWRTRPARQALLEAHGNRGLINSHQLHALDSAILSKSGFAYLLAILALLSALTLPARADLFSYKTVQFTNAVSGPLTTNGQIILAANQVLTVNSDPIPIAAKRGLGLWGLTQCSGAATYAETNTFDVGTVYLGATNWTTTHPISLISTPNGATLAINWANIPDTTLNNASLIRWATAMNGPVQSTNSVEASWSTYSP